MKPGCYEYAKSFIIFPPVVAQICQHPIEFLDAFEARYPDRIGELLISIFNLGRLWFISSMHRIRTEHLPATDVSCNGPTTVHRE